MACAAAATGVGGPGRLLDLEWGVALAAGVLQIRRRRGGTGNIRGWLLLCLGILCPCGGPYAPRMDIEVSRSKAPSHRGHFVNTLQVLGQTAATFRSRMVAFDLGLPAPLT